MALIRIVLSILLVFLVSCSRPEHMKVSAPVDATHVDRGRVLVKGLAACGFCHGETPNPRALLTGGQILEDKYGEVTAPNLTPADAGLAQWDANQILTVMRGGRSPQGRMISPEVHKGFEWLSNQDALSIVSYLQTLQPYEQKVEKRNVSWVGRYTVGIMDKERIVTGYVPELTRKHEREYGKYLVDHVARCNSCHGKQAGFFSESEYLAGGQNRFSAGEQRIVPNISGSKVYGIGEWSDEEVVHYLRSGRAPGNKIISPDFCPVEFYANAPQEDLMAIARYLRSVGEVPG